MILGSKGWGPRGVMRCVKGGGLAGWGSGREVPWALSCWMILDW